MPDLKEIKGRAVKILIYILKRILQTIPLLFIVSLISFFIIRLSPVDPLAELKLNPSISKENLQKETERLGLSKPIYVQYFLWAKSFVKGDLGVCSTGERVAAKLKERIVKGPLESDETCALRGRDAQRILEEEMGVKYSLSAVYNVLRRIGLSPLRPRPQHPKNDPAKSEEWLESAPFCPESPG